jgi:hypothetical protein
MVKVLEVILAAITFAHALEIEEDIHPITLNQDSYK